jgi:hypothetical protein
VGAAQRGLPPTALASLAILRFALSHGCNRLRTSALANAASFLQVKVSLEFVGLTIAGNCSNDAHRSLKHPWGIAMRLVVFCFFLLVSSNAMALPSELWVENTETLTVEPSGVGKVLALCPANTQLVSGGFAASSPQIAVTVSAPMPDGKGWRVGVTNTSTASRRFEVTAHALCLPKPRTDARQHLRTPDAGQAGVHIRRIGD